MQNTKYSISYILSTKNRLPWLKILFEHLMHELKDDEEIVVVDGDSSDGSKEYLNELFVAKNIHQFISEPDKNQAQGWNKAMLMARGTIIKKIIDDDVFCYSAIRKCKNYMLENRDVDVIISNDLGSNLGNYQHIERSDRLTQYKRWKSGDTPSFTFGDVHMLIRRSSLSWIGIYNPSYTMLDWEYSLRISYAKANVVYYTGYNALSVTHLNTVSSSKDEQRIKEQSKRAHVFYEYPGDTAEISAWSKIKIFIGKLINRNSGKADRSIEQIGNLDVIYDHYYKYLEEINQSPDFTFLTSGRVG